MYQKNENEGEGNRETRIKIDEENGEYSRYTSVSPTRDTLCFWLIVSNDLFYYALYNRLVHKKEGNRNLRPYLSV